MDCFAILQLDRRLQLTADEIAAQVRDLSKSLHPDAGGIAADFERLTEAERILRDPVQRMRHWLQLEFPERELPRDARISADVMEFFQKAGPIFQAHDEFLQKKSRADTTALVLALLEKNEVLQVRGLLALGGELRAAMATRIAKFSEVEELAAGGKRETAWDLGVSLAGELAFLQKWQEEAQRRLGLGLG